MNATIDRKFHKLDRMTKLVSVRLLYIQVNMDPNVIPLH